MASFQKHQVEMSKSYSSLNGNPQVSFLIPTFNADQYLDRCLKSIYNQSYPIEKIQVIIADGGSTDQTLTIAKRYPVKIIDNPERVAEAGKTRAFEHATGDVIILLDSDNIIVERDWLSRILLPLKENTDIVGVESNYLVAPDFSSINAYATLLVIADPLARMFASRPKLTSEYDSYLVKTFAKDSTPVAGANGFCWRRDAIEPIIKDTHSFNETALLMRLAGRAPIKIGNVNGVGIYHYYCESFSDYLAKRRKIAGKHLTRSKKGASWTQKVSPLRKASSALYLGTIVGPAIEGCYNWLKTGKSAWLWHPVASFMTIVVYGINYKRRLLGLK